MEKQDKVLNKIKLSQKHGNEGQLGTKKNDECYTSLIDINTELSHYAEAGRFVGKNIICPCDWDIADDEEIYSINIIYKDLDVEVIGNNVYKAVKKVSIQKYAECGYEPAFDLSDSIPQDKTELVTIDLAEDEIEDFLRDKLTCNFLRTLTQNARAWGIKSITASGYNPANDRGIKFQDVDYSKYDLCITNPPFSLYSTFMKCIVGHIDFIVLAPFMNRTNPCIGVPLMTKQAYLGFGRHLALCFNNPTKENKYNTKMVACDWITSFPDAQLEYDNKQVRHTIDYELYKDEYMLMPKMIMKDDTVAIKVPMTYPTNYDGWMFGGINILDTLNQNEYEWYMTHCTGYLNAHPEISPFKNKIKEIETLKGADGKGNFGGIIFRKRQVNKDE